MKMFATLALHWLQILFRIRNDTVDGSKIWRSPVEVGTLCHISKLQGLGYIQTVLGLGISEPSTVVCPSFVFWSTFTGQTMMGKSVIQRLNFLVMLRTTPENFPGARNWNLFLKGPPKRKNIEQTICICFPSIFLEIQNVDFFRGHNITGEHEPPNPRICGQPDQTSNAKPGRRKGSTTFFCHKCRRPIFLLCVF